MRQKNKYYKVEEALKHSKQVKELSLKNRVDENFTDFRQFPNLEKLSLHGVTPYTLDKIDYAKDLPIKSIAILYSDLKEVPDFIFQLPELIELNLSYNPLKEIPKEIAEIPNLEVLELSRISLQELPENLQQLKSLRVLALSYNRLKEFPKFLKYLPNLEELYISHNLIAELPQEFALLNLKTLHIGYNPFFDDFGQKQKQIANLLRQFSNHNYSEKERVLYFHLYLRNFDKVPQIASELDIWEATNASSELVRSNALAYLYKNIAKPVINIEENKKVKFCIAGKIKLIEELESRLEAQEIAFSKRLSAETTHMVVGEKPKKIIQKAQEKAIPLITLGHLRDFLHQKENYYLQQENQMSKEMITKILDLLNSSEISNQTLALDIILGGGLPEDLLYEVLFLYLWNGNNETKNQAERVLAKHLPFDLFTHIRSYCKAYYDMPNDNKISQYLENVCIPPLNPSKLGLTFYKKTHTGKYFCLQYEEAFDEVYKTVVVNSALHLNHIKIEELKPFIGKYTKIKMLYLKNNCLSSLPNVLSNLKKLYILSLKKNNFKEIPQVLLDLPKLTDLDLSNNQIKSLPENIDKFPKLERLILSNNKIKELPSKLKNLSSLKSIDLRKTPIARKGKYKVEAYKSLPKDCEMII